MIDSPSSIILLSLRVALVCTTLGIVPAVATGYVLHRIRSASVRTVLSTIVLLPLALPPVVTGLVLLRLFGRGGPFAGLDLPFTEGAAVVAALVVSFPLLTIGSRAAFEAVDDRFREVSGTLGAAPWRTFLQVTLPLAWPGILGAAVLAWARSLGEFGATIVLAGNIPGKTQTIAAAVYTLLESPTPHPAMNTLL
ncbi:MAG: ABC transporter permease subunit, partial [Myxococcales bacterium]|nr:ABC transporter permease subunit [Myxococcales bacterium]